jgi:hypothetical protein
MEINTILKFFQQKKKIKKKISTNKIFAFPIFKINFFSSKNRTSNYLLMQQTLKKIYFHHQLLYIVDVLIDLFSRRCIHQLDSF